MRREQILIEKKAQDAVRVNATSRSETEGYIHEPDKTPSVDLHQFLRDIWWIVEPDTPFTDGPHLHAVCRHMEAALYGFEDSDGLWRELRRLLICLPPGMTKSMICSVAAPCWAWTYRPTYRFLLFSHNDDLVSGLANKRRSVLMSEYYRDNWTLAAALSSHDKRLAAKFLRKTRDTSRLTQNVAGGQMLAVTTGMGVTGLHPHVIIGDDPIQPPDGQEMLRSDPRQLKEYRLWRRSKLVSRGYTDDVAAKFILVNQRVCTGDPVDVELEEHPDACLLNLPMEYIPDHPVRDPQLPTPLGFVDWRTEPGELLAPNRAKRSTVDALRETLGPHNAAAQLDQNPQAAVGEQFQPEWIKIVDELPEDEPIEATARAWDLAATENAGDYSSGGKVHRLQVREGRKNPRYVIANVNRGQWSVGKRDAMIEATAEEDGRGTDVGIEQEGGAAGKSVVEGFKARLAGYRVHECKVSGDKETRAHPLASQMELGNVLILRGDWNAEFIAELLRFPAGAHDDQVDSVAHAFNMVTKQRRKVLTRDLLLIESEETQDDDVPTDRGVRQVLTAGSGDVDVEDPSPGPHPAFDRWQI